jgi:hypothetical protein
MALQVVNVDFNDRQGAVTVQGDTQEEVLSSGAKNMALQAAAQQGLSRPGLSGGESAYPVDAEGKTSDELILGQGEVAGYRCEYKITGGL